MTSTEHKRESAQINGKVLIVILNFRTPQMTCECLESFRSDLEKVPSAHIALVDNGSGDNSVEEIQSFLEAEKLNERVSLVTSEKNLGFSAANNLAIRMFPEFKYILLANSDILLLEPTLEHCLAEMDAQARVAAYSCRVNGPDDLLQNNARTFPTPIKMILRQTRLPFKYPSLFGFADIEDATWDRDNTRREVDWLSGCFLLLRKSVLDQVGLLDEEFFFYGEDVELCYRIHKAGFTCLFDNRISIKHFGGGSSDPDRLPSRRQIELKYTGEFVAIRKCYGLAACYLVYCTVVLIMLGRRIKIRVFYGEDSTANAWASATLGAMLSVWRTVLLA